MDKSKEFLHKIITYIRENKKIAVITVAIILAIIAAIIVIICISGNSEQIDEQKWGEGLTKDVPMFSEEFKSFDFNENYQAMYFENVTTEQIKDYEAKLSELCGISFEGEIYPRSAVFGDRIIVIHYNVTEMKFSVTVTQKNNS